MPSFGVLKKVVCYIIICLSKDNLLKFWKTVLTCTKLKLNLIAISHFKSANMYVVFEV